MTEPDDDVACVARCLQGDSSAFEPIVRRYQRVLFSVARRMLGNHEDASDLAQDVFIRAYRALRTFKGESSLGTWLYRIAVNVSLNKVAAKAPKPEPLDRLLLGHDERAASRDEDAADTEVER